MKVRIMNTHDTDKVTLTVTVTLCMAVGSKQCYDQYCNYYHIILNDMYLKIIQANYEIVGNTTAPLRCIQYTGVNITL